jgi:hypothetical protein
MKKLKENLTKQAGVLLDEHAAALDGLAANVRLGLALTCAAAAFWSWRYAPAVMATYLLLALVWLAAMLAGRMRKSLSDAGVLLDITIVHATLLAFIVQGFFPRLGGGAALFYFPSLALAAACFRQTLIIKAGLYAGLGYLALALYGGSPPWFKLAAIALTTFVAFTASFKPKSLLTALAQQAAEQGYELGASRKEAELTAQIHQLFMPEPIIDLPLIWSSAKHGAGAETTGDYYQLFETARGPLLVIGDLTGRGVESLRGVAQLHQKLTQIVHQETELPKIAAALNQYVFEKHEGHRPFTCVLAQWEGEQMRYVNAGHLPIIQMNPQLQQLPVNNAQALGAKLSATFNETTAPFPARNLALFYTDGLYRKLTEDSARGAAEVERLAAQFSGSEVTTLCHRIFDCAQPGLEQIKDDATMVVVRRQPAAVAAATESKT